MNILLSLISSGAIKWLSILILVGGLVSGLYMKHRQIVDLEKQTALQQYNINQLQQNVNDNKLYIQKMEEISNHKSKIVADLYIEKDSLEEKMKKLEISVEKQAATGGDRESSKILKDVIKELGNQQ